MNIVIFSWRGPGHPNAGGAEIVTHEHAKAWVKAGHNVTLFTSFFPGGKSEEVLDGVRIIRRGNDFIVVKINALKWYLTLKDKPDLVIDQFHGIPFFTPLYIKEKKIAFIHEVTKEVWWMNHLPFPSNVLYATIGYFSEPFIFRLFYRNIPFVTVSESTMEDLKKWGVRHITVIHNGFSPPKSDIIHHKSDIKTAIYLGTLARDKGIEDALKAFALINQSEKGWQFWVVGRGDPRYLKELKVKSQKLKVNVKFWGFVSEKEKFELLARSWVMLNPSVREGWGLVNIEANSVGTPVVAYNVPGNKDSVKNGYSGVIIKNISSESLAAEALKLIKDRERYENMEKTTRKWSERFNWSTSTKQSLKFVERLV